MSFDLSKPIAIGSDHAGYEHRIALIQWLGENGYAVKDVGVYENNSCDYPDYAHPVANMVQNGEVAFGILLCGSANGVCITANKHQGIRAGLSFHPEVARLIRLHNDANIIGIPARFVSLEEAKEMLEIFIKTGFEGGRHQARVDKIRCD
jgi:ribose 5-phosphate isomerase B